MPSPSSELTPPKKWTRAVVFSVGSFFANFGNGLMERSSDPPPPAPPPPLVEETPNPRFHLEVTLVCDPETASVDPSETIRREILLDISMLRTGSEALSPQGDACIELSDKTIHFHPFMINIEKARVASIEKSSPVQ